MNVIEDLKENSFLNNFGWDGLNCVVKPICIVSESLIKNTSLFRILFTRLWLKEKYEKFIIDNTHIRFDLEFKGGENFFEDLNNFIKNQQHIILVTNTFYEELHEDTYQKTHHNHFTVLKGYDCSQKKYIIIDQDFTKDYSSESKYKDGVQYIQKLIKPEKLARISLDIKSVLIAKSEKNIFKNKDLGDKNYYGYLEAINLAPYIKEIKKKDVFDIYKNQLLELVENADESKNIFKEEVSCFEKKYESSILQANKDTKVRFTRGYPRVLELIRTDNDHVITQKTYFLLSAEKNEITQKMFELFNNLLGKYQILKSSIRKCIVAKNKYVLNEIGRNIDNIIDYEIVLYKYMLENFDIITKNI